MVGIAGASEPSFVERSRGEIGTVLAERSNDPALLVDRWSKDDSVHMCGIVRDANLTFTTSQVAMFSSGGPIPGKVAVPLSAMSQSGPCIEACGHRCTHGPIE